MQNAITTLDWSVKKNNRDAFAQVCPSRLDDVFLFVDVQIHNSLLRGIASMRHRT
jgi:hypothetical protein